VFEPAKDSVLSAEDFAPENTKIRITTMISGDVLDWLRTEAKAKGIGYQTLLDMKLRELMMSPGDSSTLSGRLSKLEQEWGSIRVAMIDPQILMEHFKIDVKTGRIEGSLVHHSREAPAKRPKEKKA